ncbi:MAG: hypothetical protein HeimC2_32480 [Candidatus Heimdallarchaeota archaeon LC_2]|nr:MAG: hypothetical protein HeimC2_32480 [Candidatus Heimdallarchaeota archaeon LC_2]
MNIISINRSFLGGFLFKLTQIADELLRLFKVKKSLTQTEITKSFPNAELKDIKYALRRLREKGVIKRLPNLKDMRRVYYQVATRDEFIKSSNILTNEEISFFQEILGDLFDNW